MEMRLAHGVTLVSCITYRTLRPARLRPIVSLRALRSIATFACQNDLCCIQRLPFERRPPKVEGGVAPSTPAQGTLHCDLHKFLRVIYASRRLWYCLDGYRDHLRQPAPAMPLQQGSLFGTRFTAINQGVGVETSGRP